MRFLKYGLIVLGVLFVGIGGPLTVNWIQRPDKPAEVSIDRFFNLIGALMSAKQAKETAAVSIGGPFELIGGDGEVVTQEDFAGKHMLVYFGYTYCPDVCPSSLAVMGQALDALPQDKAEEVAPVFVTVDPQRDTPEVVGEYVKHFHPRLVGLTGSPAQVEAAAKAYKVYFAKGEGEALDAYLMDHSSITYLMGPDGKFVTHFGHGTGPEVMVEKLNDIL